MKKIYLVILTFILTLSFNMTFANTINSINMDIYVDEEGSAHVTETWNCFANEDTEWYHTYKNIGGSEIINFVVKDEDNKTYENVSSWNIKGSFEDKKYKSGINKIDGGVELCFGISEYNTTKIYTTTYTITNFVANLEDSQMIYWTLIDYSKEIGNVYIKIYSDFKYLDTYDVWGFGNYGGTSYVYDGYIEMQSPGNLESNEYMTLLVKFPPNTFKEVKYKLDSNFEYYLNLAKEGSTQYSEDNKIFFIMYILFIAIVTFSLMSASKASRNDGKITSSKDRNEIKNYKEYYRDIPCDRDFYMAYYLSYEYSILTNKNNLLGAILLDWIRKKYISVEKREVGFLSKKEEVCIILRDDLILENELENKLYKMIFKASKNGILEKKEFEKWANHNYDDFLKWFDDVINKQREKLLNSGVLKLKDKKPGLFAEAKDIYEFKDKDKMFKEAQKLKGLKNYLNDYTLIHERESIEVNIFEEYLVYAQIFGIAKKVIEQFKELYPQVISESSFEDYNTLMYIRSTSYSISRTASTARSRASSYSSGGGGFSSGGGGGGSFGGGRRRFSLIKILKIII